MLKTLPIEQRASFKLIRYSNVWEDADLLCRALGPGAKGQRLLSIASAGDNVLALLTLRPKTVVAADLSSAQLACLDLRIAAFQSLNYENLLAFLGVSPSPSRARDYRRLRSRLSPSARAFWDAQPDAIAAGPIHVGKLERYLQRYSRWLQRWVHGPAKVSALFSTPGYFQAHWNSWRWRLLNRLAFSRRAMGSQGRDPEFFRHAGADVTSGPSQRLETLLSLGKLNTNPYLRYQLTGNYAPEALPLYLRPQHYKSIRALSDRVQLFLGQVQDAPGRYWGFNLSNIFEYMSEAQHAACYGALLDKALPGARLAYWNLHVKRACPATELKRVRPSLKLKQVDQYWAYSAFRVDEVKRNQ